MVAAPHIPPVPAVLRLVQSVVLGRWRTSVESLYRERVVECLGRRPYLIVEWKRMMRDAGLVELTVQDWTDRAGARGQARVS